MNGTVWVGLALFAGLGGVVAYLAGLAGLNETRRLRRVGVRARALVRYRTLGPEDRTAAARPLLQFATAGGQVVEVYSPVASSRTRALVDGGEVWLSYDPADPGRVLVEGRERRWLEYLFVGCGAVIVLTALAMLLLDT